MPFRACKEARLLQKNRRRDHLVAQWSSGEDLKIAGAKWDPMAYRSCSNDEWKSMITIILMYPLTLFPVMLQILKIDAIQTIRIPLDRV